MHIDEAASSVVNKMEKGTCALFELQTCINDVAALLSCPLVFTVIKAQGSMMELTTSGQVRR